MEHPHYSWRQFGCGIVSPAILVLVLFILAIFGIITPAVESAITDRKKEMIRELTVAAWGVLAECERQEQSGQLSREQAQRLALTEIRHLRYGSEGKDYFWITDLHPRMVMHPYRSELDGADVSGYQDAHGDKVFVKFVGIARTQGEGYSTYLWQWKDDPKRIEPKLSFVKLFEPWGWIVGTGVYLDDVRAETQRLTGRLARISLGIAAILALLLLWIGRQSYVIERRRRQAEHDLRESESKYRMLVESAAEGILLVADRRVLFCNRPVLAMLGMEETACRGRPLMDLLVREEAGTAALEEWLGHGRGPARFEARLLGPDEKPVPVALAVSPVAVGGQPGLLISLRETQPAMAALNQPPFSALLASPDIGFFRAGLDPRGQLLDASPGMLALIGSTAAGSLPRITIPQLFPDAVASQQFFGRLMQSQELQEQILQLRRQDGRLLECRISAVTVRDSNGEPLFCEGIIEDVTAAQAAAALRDQASASLQGAALFLMAPVGSLAAPAQICGMDTPACEAAARMAREQQDAILICGPGGSAIGMVTSGDLQNRVLAAGLPPDQPVGGIMTAPLTAIAPDTRVYQALHLMQAKGIGHLAVREAGGRCIGLVSHRDLLRLEQSSLPSLLRQAQAAETVADLQRLQAGVPATVRLLLAAGARASHVTDFLSGLCDAMLERLVVMAIRDLGPAPVPFAFLAFGSEGRREQTLATDQDNALVYADPPVGGEDACAVYFLALAARVCDGLNAAGYRYCRGDVMARNPRWCRTLSQWRTLFAEWLEHGTPEALQTANIVFDFRHAAGDETLSAELRRQVLQAAEARDAFFFNLARSTLEFKPPLGLFGKIMVESGGHHPETFDIKTGLVPIVNFARVYALRRAIPAVGTLERIRELTAAGILQPASAAEIREAFETLSAWRLRHQAAQLARGETPDNHVNPHELTEIEQATLRRIFEQIAVFQAKLRLDFTQNL